VSCTIERQEVRPNSSHSID